MTLEDIISKITAFRDDRDWSQYHSVRNLIAAINVEAGELQEAVLWKANDEVAALLESQQGSRRALSACRCSSETGIVSVVFSIGRVLNESQLRLAKYQPGTKLPKGNSELSWNTDQT